MKLLLALECENFTEQRRALRSAGPPPPGRLGSPVVPPRALREVAGGALLLVDWAEGRVLTRLDLPAPSGFCWPDPEGPLWVACQGIEQIVSVDPGSGAIVSRLNHHAFNDLHRLAARPGGGLVVSCSGTDSVVALAEHGAEIWSWWGNPDLDRGRSHAADEIPTLARRVHPVSVVPLTPDSALVSSFHDGAILEVRGDAPPRVLLDGLRQPHGLVRAPHGWWVADTGRGRILRLSPSLQIVDVVAEGFRWLQDLAPTEEGGVLVVENRDFRGSDEASGGPRLLELDAQGRELARLQLSPDWRLGSLLVLDEARAGRIRWPTVRVRARHHRSPPGETGPG